MVARMPNLAVAKDIQTMRVLVATVALLLAPAAIAAASKEVDLGVSPGVVWSGWESKSAIAAGKFSSARFGDELVLQVSAVSAAVEWPQIVPNTAQGAALPGTSGYQLKGKTPTAQQPEVCSFFLTEAAVSELKANGCKIAGTGFTLLAAKLRSNNFDPKQAGILGTPLYVCHDAIDWSEGPSNHYVSLSPSVFADLRAGQTLRFKVEATGPGAVMHINYSDPATYAWTDFADAPDNKAVQGDYVDYDVTARLASDLKRYGCQVVGQGYTLTSVAALDPDDIQAMTLTIDDESIWAYAANQQPKITLTLANYGDTPVSTVVRLQLKTDALEPYGEPLEQTAQVEARRACKVTFTLPALPPGFYQLNASANEVSATPLMIGSDPRHVIAEPDAAPDFEQFWRDALQQLSRTPLNATLTLMKKGTARTVYLVEMQSVGDGPDAPPVKIHAYWARPNDKSDFPAFITYQGYDGGGTSELVVPDADKQGDWGELIVSTRGQYIDNRPPRVNTYGDFFSFHFGEPSSYYYRGAYCDAVRAIDFVLSQPGVQVSNVFANGVSQGGAFTLAAAALDNGRLNSVAVGVSFMGDFPNYFRVAVWPGNVAKALARQKGMSDEQMYASLAYFDTKNLAPWVTCPVKAFMSLQDATCPPRTNFAPFNNLSSSDTYYVLNRFHGHSPGSLWWNGAPLQWFTDHLKSGSTVVPAALRPVEEMGKADKCPVVYDLQGRPVKGGDHGLHVVVSGNKARGVLRLSR